MSPIQAIGTGLGTEITWSRCVSFPAFGLNEASAQVAVTLQRTSNQDLPVVDACVLAQFRPMPPRCWLSSYTGSRGSRGFRHRRTGKSGPMQNVIHICSGGPVVAVVLLLSASVLPHTIRSMAILRSPREVSVMKLVGGNQLVHPDALSCEGSSRDCWARPSPSGGSQSCIGNRAQTPPRRCVQSEQPDCSDVQGPGKSRPPCIWWAWSASCRRGRDRRWPPPVHDV